MNVIIDASCIIAILADEPERNIVIEKTKGTELIAPACLPYEIGNSLTAMVKRHRIDSTKAVETMEMFKKIPIRLLEPDIVQSVKIASEENHYAYDAYYISCALERNIPLLTFDKTLIEIAERRGVKCL